MDRFLDNLTHTLAGLAIGELIARSARIDVGGLPAATRRTALLAIGMIGGSLPDSDIFWSGLSSGSDNLGYLLEHRGYTHTLIGCGALALLLFAGTLLCLHWRGYKVGARDRWLLAVTTLLSLLLHIVMDTLNSYGVHPFWPWDNHWYYGDAVFIIEPLYWLAAAPLLFGLRTRVARVLLGLVLVGGCALMLFFHRFATPWCVIAAAAAALVWAGRRMTPRAAASFSFALMLTVTLGFIFTSRVVESRVRDIAQQQFPAFRTVDVVMSPIPVHPLCWDVLLVQRTERDYAVRRGQFSLSAVPASCPQIFGDSSGTAPLRPTATATADRDGMRWTGEFTLPLTALMQLVSADCRARELMQFNRAPFIVMTANGQVLGDLRFDRESGLGMAEIVVTPDQPFTCSHAVPWLPPRGDLLDAP